MDTSLMCNDYVETSYFSCDVFPSVCCGCGVLYEYEEEIGRASCRERV